MAIGLVETGLVKTKAEPDFFTKPEPEKTRIIKPEPIGFVRVSTDSNKKLLTSDSIQRALGYDVVETVEIELEIQEDNGSTF